MGNFSAPVPSFYIQDHLGNTRVTYEMDCGPLGARRNLEYVGDYLPYGGILREHIVDRRERFLTTEHERDDQTQLDYRGARYSDSRWGVFMSVDPLAGERTWLSPYNYVQNNPINRIDPTGALDDPIHDSKTGEFLGHYNDSDFDGEIMLMDASSYEMITGGENVVLSPEYAEQYGTYLQDYIGSNYKSDPAGGKELVSNVMTSLLSEASNAGLIDLDMNSLSKGKINIQDAYGRIASSGPGYDGKWEVTGYINTFSQNEEFTTDGNRSLWFLNNAGDAINILGVHEPLHKKYPGNHNHSIIDPRVLNPKTNPAINLASPQYIQHVQSRMARN